MTVENREKALSNGNKSELICSSTYHISKVKHEVLSQVNIISIQNFHVQLASHKVLVIWKIHWLSWDVRRHNPQNEVGGKERNEAVWILGGCKQTLFTALTMGNEWEFLWISFFTPMFWSKIAKILPSYINLRKSQCLS